MGLEKIVVDSKKGIGLVLSGGGGRGAYQVGVIKALKERGINFQLVAGTSVGALNATLVASDRIGKMMEIWENLNPTKVAGFGNIFGGYLLDTKPLEKTIRNGINEEVIKKIKDSLVKLIVISSCLQNGKQIVYQNFKSPEGIVRVPVIYRELNNYEELVKALLASTAVPLAFPFQKFHHTEKGEITQLVDGGTINNFPIKEAIEANSCKTFFTNSLYTIDLLEIPQKRWYRTDLMNIGMRTLEIFFANSYAREMALVNGRIDLADSFNKKINKFGLTKSSKKAKEAYSKYLSAYQGLKIIEINPERELPADFPDFFSDKAKKAIAMGYEDASKVLENVIIK